MSPLRGWLSWVWLAFLPLLAQAQTSPDSTQTSNDTTAVAAPTVAPASGGAASVPSTEFETYNVSGRGSRYTAALTGLYTTGTVERTFLSISQTVNFAFRGGRFQLPVAGSFSYGKQGAVVKEREFLLLLTPSLRRGRFKLYGLSESSRSNLRAIDYRLVHGAGLGYTLYQDTLKNELGLSYFLLYEDTQYLTELHRQVLRHSLRGKVQLSRGPTTLSALLYYQPAARTPTDDYRVNGTAALAVRLWAKLALTLTYNYSFEKISVAGRSPTNTNLSAGFTYSTGK